MFELGGWYITGAYIESEEGVGPPVLPQSDGKKVFSFLFQIQLSSYPSHYASSSPALGCQSCRCWPSARVVCYGVFH
jgi:hypothetical protein